MNNIKAVLFDMDGVILDNQYILFDMLRKALKHKGVDVSTMELVDAYIGLTSNMIYTKVIEKYGLSETTEELRGLITKLTGNYYVDADIEPMSGLLQVLNYLKKQDIRLALVSSTSSHNILSAMNRLSLIKYFDVIIGGDMLKQAKPAPEGYQTAAKQLGVDVKDALVIEDSSIGIQAAKNAGIKVIGFAGSMIKQDLSKADYQFDSFDELLQWMKC